MSWSSRRAILVLTVVVGLGGLSLVPQVYAQVRARRVPVPPPPPPPPAFPAAPVLPGKQAYDLGSLTLPKDDDLKDRIDAATDNIKRKDWERACKTLQDLVGRPNDVWVPLSRTDPAGREIPIYVSAKKEAARLIGSLPRAGRDFYEATYGPKAEAMVKQARTNNDRTQMGQAMGLYLYTEAGAEAANWLGSYHLDRAEFQAATRFYLQLVHRAGVKALKDRTLLKAAYAFHHAGDLRARELAFKELLERGIEITLRDEPRSGAELVAAIHQMKASVSQQSASDSPIYRSRPNRNGMLPGGTPFLEPAWKQKMVRIERTAEKLKEAENKLLSRNLPVLCTFFPVTATVARGEKRVPLLIYRSYWGIHAVNMKTGKLEWDSPSDWSVDHVLGLTGRQPSDSQKVTAYNTWLGQFVQQNIRPQILFENSVLGALSADSKMIFAIEDLAVPPPAHMAMADPRTGANFTWGDKVTQAIGHNKLQAFSLAKEGSLVWDSDDQAALADTYFLGAPLPINGRLYVLTEKQQELQLAALDPATGKLLGLQTLANTKDLKLSQDPIRRTQAAHLCYGEGILVVPTNAGAVFGVDLLSNSLVWAYPYREAAGAPSAPTIPNPGGVAFPGRGNPIPPGFIRRPDGTYGPPSTEVHWQVTAPVIQDGKVVFTAPDAKGIHCVSLRDGARLWTHSRRDDDLYLAGVFNGKVLIVGKHRTRALSLNRGDTLWEVETGVPSGQGAASAPVTGGDVLYYLPIREAVNTRDPEICALNVDRGLIQAHTRSRKREAPGNLIFYEGNVLSQTHTEVTAYPQLEIKLAEMDRLVKANPDDPAALTDRGDYLLDKGDLGGAIADFRKALKHRPADGVRAKARTKLYEAFTELFQRDFPRAEEYLQEYQDVCKLDLTGKEGAERAALLAEERNRRVNFLCLVGKGREAQNRLLDAFEKYLEVAAEARKDELIHVVDEPSVQTAPDVWSRGRIAGMVQHARDPRQKKAVEDRVTAKWNELKDSKASSLDELRQFVALFGSLFDVGKEARLTLAERLMEDTEVNSLLEAEQQLSLLRGEQESPQVAARAIEALARLNTRKGLLEDAAFYYRLLGEKYPKVTVDGKTGEEYLEDLATDKRFLPYLDQTGRFTIRGKAELRVDDRQTGPFPYTTQTYQFAHVGEALPFFMRNKLALQMDWNHRLMLRDTATGEERWKPGLKLTPTKFQLIATTNPQPHRVKFSYQTLGHLVVLQLGNLVFGIDPLNKGRVLWERNLSSVPGPAPTGTITVDPRDNSVVVVYADGWMQRLGEAGPLQGGVICLQMRDSLTAIDPVLGRTLWTRSDVNSRNHVFGDEQHVYVVGMGASGGSTGTRVFRAYDGVSVKAPDFSRAYDERVRLVGRNILATDVDAKGVRTLRIYDVMQGRDVWKQTFPVGSMLLESEDPNLAGVVEPTGMVRVIDVRTQKDVLNTRLDDPKHVQGAKSVILVSDADALYLAVNGPPDPDLVSWSAAGVQSNLMTGAGLRSVPVNGMLYSFDRKTGERNWYNPVPNQQMVLSMFEDMPMLLFTARYQKWHGQGPARSTINVTEALAIAKHNGKRWYFNDNVPYGMYFHGLTMDHRTGKVEFTGYQLKVTLTAVPK